MKRFVKNVALVLLVRLLFIILCLVIPPAFHKRATPEDWLNDIRYEHTAPERVRSIDDNSDALLWRLRLIEEAKERIILTTFDFWDEESGQDVIGALWAAAERGVRVQVLLDGINGGHFLPMSRNLCQLSSHENVEIRLYNPINLLTPWKINYRMHDKYLIADDFAYILGGRNTDNRFLGNYQEHYNVDRDILVYETEPGAGQSYQQLMNYFEAVWALPCCKVFKDSRCESDLAGCYEQTAQRYPEVFTDSLTTAEWESATLAAYSVELWSNPIEPENKTPILWARMVDAMAQDSNVLVQTPYIICSKDMYEDLRTVCAAGTRTDILINAVESGTNPFGCTDYLNQKTHLRSTGTHIYEYLGEQAQHTKAVLIGEDLTLAGSCNFDMRSVYLDTELMLAIKSPGLNAQIRAQLDVLKESSRHMSPDGSIEDGPSYVPRKLSWGKEAMYAVLRVITLPFRHLL